MLWWTLRYTCLFPFWFPWCVCPAVGLLGHNGSYISSFLRNLHTILHSGYTSLHSHHSVRGFDSLGNNILQSDWTILLSYQQWIRIPVSLYPHYHLLLFIIAILVVKHWVLIWNVKYLFMSSLKVFIPSLVKCPIISFSHFFKFLIRCCLSYYCVRVFIRYVFTIILSESFF